jgi:cobalt-zinc-cadmium efflux system membrane fusion protein
MFAQATLMGPAQNRVVLPMSALLMNNDRVTVFVETAPWTFERRTVDADLQDGATATIRAGLTGGEKIVIKGGILLND